MNRTASECLPMSEDLNTISHRPWPLPTARHVMAQRWNDLLFAHWPMRAAEIESLLPDGLEADVFQGSAWIGVVPFWMDKIQVWGLPPIPGARQTPELNLRTYVRDTQTGMPGVYFFSLEAGNLLAVMMARGIFHLPYYWAQMKIEPRGEQEFSFYSKRLLSAKPVRFMARYRGLGPTRRLVQSRPGTIEYFLTERYCLFTRDALGRLLRAQIHHLPWPLEEAEAVIEENDLASALGLELPRTRPLLHYSRRLAVYVWSPEVVLPAVVRAGTPVVAQ
ncbi:YqjF family protein [Acidicapsa ligni]|uniref:YqjF family protein n=1 Tax=Acidicapsa ligni TaxID=542300 RepID=UPI0021E0B6B3|nr:DUF2071 domain-containing protein [Acidicapsa ligni]